MRPLIQYSLLSFLAMVPSIPLPGQSRCTISEIHAVNDDAVVTLTNTSNQPITSFLIKTTVLEGEKRRGEFLRYLDVYTNVGSDHAIAPGEHKEISLFPSSQLGKSAFTAKLEAVGFNDGSFDGNDIAIRAVGDRRRRMVEALSFYRTILQRHTADGELSTTLGDVLRSATSRHRELGSPTGATPYYSFVHMVDSQVAEWLKQVMQRNTAPLQNPASIVDYMVRGLDTWQAETARGLAPRNRAVALQ